MLNSRANIENQVNADFDSNFNYLFMEKMRLASNHKVGNNEIYSSGQTITENDDQMS